MFASNTSQVSSAANYIEDVFSTYLYTGNGSTQTITNGIDLAGKGGLVWAKARTFGTDHQLSDSAIGPTKSLSSSSTLGAGSAGSTDITGFTSSGFSLNYIDGRANQPSEKFVSWTFRKQPKFFDVVTYTGSGASGKTVSHNLGSSPGCIIIKRTSSAGNDWYVWHTAVNQGSFLNTTLAFSNTYKYFSSVSSTNFVFNTGNSIVNANGSTYVAYIFAHNAGGFGLAGTDDVISCGSYTGNGSATGPVVNLGWEPQWLLIKDATTAGTGWNMYDNMRGIATGGSDALLLADVSNAETTSNSWIDLNSTGFQPTTTNQNVNSSGDTYIYIAIRRGPMRTPTTGASVFEPAFATANSPEYKSNTVISGFDTALTIYRAGYSDASFSYPYTAARLTGARQILQTSRTNAEYTYSTAANFAYNTGWFDSTFGNDTNRESYMFKRAPGFHDVVCYTGTGVAGQTFAHNLGVVPELMIVKKRSSTDQWNVYHSLFGGTKYLQLNSTAAVVTQDNIWNNTNPTASVFSVGVSGSVNTSGGTYFAMLFASCPGVSKVGSYTGTGTTKQVDCGFAAGARFVLIKRTDSTGDWYVWDSARGIVSGNDPYLLLNSTAAEVTSTDYIDTYSAGFEISSTAPAAINASGGTYIFLAIA